MMVDEQKTWQLEMTIQQYKPIWFPVYTLLTFNNYYKLINFFHIIIKVWLEFWH